jgi:hypothetical protein
MYEREKHEKSEYKKGKYHKVKNKKEQHEKEEHKKQHYIKQQYDSYKTINKILAMFDINIETGIVKMSGKDPEPNEDGYLCFKIKGHKRPFFCHILVWMKANNSFVPKRRQLHHKNKIKTDNRIENLQCVTKREHEKIHNRKLFF